MRIIKLLFLKIVLNSCKDSYIYGAAGGDEGVYRVAVSPWSYITLSIPDTAISNWE